MKVIVLGAGVIGVTTAWYLAKAGAEVHVYDRQPGAGLETSFANAGELSYGAAGPLAAPGLPRKVLRWQFQRQRPVVFRSVLSPRLWRWSLAALANCTAARFAENRERMMRIAGYSAELLPDLVAETGIDYDGQSRGTLILLRTAEEFEAAKHEARELQDLGVEARLLDREAALEVEPGLAEADFAGGLQLVADRTGDCAKFTTGLAAAAEARGARFHFGCEISGITQSKGRITAVQTSEGPVTGDAYVCALGSYGPDLLRPLGIALPVYPVKGYSLTMPVTNPDRAPQSTLMDAANKMAMTRLGDRIRVAGMAEFAGFDRSIRPNATAVLSRIVSELFPGGGDPAKAVRWCGLRPMTPDGTPVMGETRYPNLFLNTGHGTLGWTMACGSGKAVADAVLGRETGIQLEGLTIARYG